MKVNFWRKKSFLEALSTCWHGQICKFLLCILLVCKFLMYFIVFIYYVFHWFYDFFFFFFFAI